jgi:hypothetical protein
VFAAQNVGDFDSEPADNLIGGINQPPLMLNRFFLGHERRHSGIPCKRSEYRKRLS